MKRNTSGFSFVELLVAQGVLAVGVMGIVSTLHTASRGSATDLALTTSLGLAEERMALLTTAPTAELASASATDARCEAPILEGGVAVQTVACSYASPDGVRVDLTVEVRHPALKNPVLLHGVRDDG